MNSSNETKQKILIVDDEPNIADLIALYLNKEGYKTQIAGNGTTALQLSKSFMPNIVILDLMLPDMSGYDICKEIRKTSDIPIIMLTAKGELFDKVLGLELGADDYMVKPFDTKELIARVKAVLRRYNPKSDSVDLISYDNLTINISNYSVLLNGNKLELPPKELELLYFLASHPNQVFNRDILLDKIWGYDYVGDTRTVDVHIKRIREKIHSTDQWAINTVWGIGYKFEVK